MKGIWAQLQTHAHELMHNNKKLTMNFCSVHRQCVHKIHHLAFKASHADMQTLNVHENNSRMLTRSLHFTDFSPHLQCAPEKRPKAEQNQYSELLYDFQGKAEQKCLHNTTKKKGFLCYFSSPPLSLFYLLSQSFVLPRQGILSGWFQQLNRWGRGKRGWWEGAGEERN